MIILDANLLIHATNEDDPKFAAATKWIANLVAKEPMIGLPWVSSWAFLRVVTNTRLFPHPFAKERAFESINRGLELPNVFVPQPGMGYANAVAVAYREGTSAWRFHV